MTFLSHPSCSSGFIWIRLLLKGKRQFLLTCRVSRYYLLTLHGSTRPILGTMVYMAGDSPFIAWRVNRAPLCAEWLHPIVSRFHNKNRPTFVQCFNSGPASQTVAQYKTNIVYLVWTVETFQMLQLKITVAILFKHETLNQCCFDVGLASRIVIQPWVNRDTCQCVHWALWMRFHLTNKYISI